jgi:hypothetical protein
MLGNLRSVPLSALYAIAVGSLPTWLRGCRYGTPSLKQLVRRRMHLDAVCAGIGRSVACEKGYHSTSLLLKSPALVAVDCGDHELANRLAAAGRSKVDKDKC